MEKKLNIISPVILMPDLTFYNKHNEISSVLFIYISGESKYNRIII